jgi:hypothetical protein
MSTLDGKDVTYTVTSEARTEIQRAAARIAGLGSFFGERSPQYTKAATSWARVMASVFGMPWSESVRVSSDGSNSLGLIVTGGITMGVIFHADRRYCRKDGCHAVINDDGAAWTYSPGDAVCEDGQHDLAYPLDAPAPGTWSTHT